MAGIKPFLWLSIVVGGRSGDEVWQWCDIVCSNVDMWLKWHSSEKGLFVDVFVLGEFAMTGHL